MNAAGRECAGASAMQDKHRRSTRLRDYDYSRAGAYFVTICTHDRECLFGEVVEGEMVLNALGAIVVQHWRAIPDHFAYVQLDEHVVMPNHFHGILVFAVGAQHAAPLQTRVDAGGRVNVSPGSLGAIVRSFKSAVTKQAREISDGIVPNLWQRGYYEHVIRNDRDLQRIREYVVGNPGSWTNDEYCPRVDLRAQYTAPLRRRVST